MVTRQPLRVSENLPAERPAACRMSFVVSQNTRRSSASRLAPLFTRLARRGVRSPLELAESLLDVVELEKCFSRRLVVEGGHVVGLRARLDNRAIG